MAIQISPDKIYRTQLNTTAKNAIGKITSTYKLPTVEKDTAITEPIDVRFWIGDTSNMSYVGNLSTYNTARFTKHNNNDASAFVPFVIKNSAVLVHVSGDYIDMMFTSLHVDLFVRTWTGTNDSKTSTISMNASSGQGDTDVWYRVLITENGITNDGYYHFGDGETLWLEVNAKIKPGTNIYFEQASMYLTSTKVTFQNVEETIGNSDVGNLFVEGENPFRQTDAEFYDASYRFAEFLLSKYHSPRATLEIEVVFTDYRDASTNLVIGTLLNTSANRPFFENGDVIMPNKYRYEYDDGDIVLNNDALLFKNGRRVEFVVINNRISFRGGLPRQTLYCIEKAPSEYMTLALDPDIDTPNTVRKPDSDKL